MIDALAQLILLINIYQLHNSNKLFVLTYARAHVYTHAHTFTHTQASMLGVKSLRDSPWAEETHERCDRKRWEAVKG